MKKLFAVMMLVFLVSLGLGMTMDAVDAQAKNPIPCEYRCINQDTYLCCIYPNIGEVCTWDHMFCP